MSTERISPAEAFEILGDDVRLDVLLTLADADDPLTFSELRDRTDVRDSGRFNYHLDRLRDHFVRGVEDGYELRYHGRRVVEAVLAGTFTETAEIGPFAVEGSCYDCDGALRGVYEDEHVVITCAACDERIISVDFPPSALGGRDPGEFMAAYEKWSQSQVDLAIDGVCPICGGATEREFVDVGEHLPFERLPDFRCTACGHRAVTSFAAIALRTPAVAEFYADHGTDIEERPYWDVEPVVTGEYTTVESWEPLRVEVGFPADDARLRVTLDDDLDVVEAVRVRG